MRQERQSDNQRPIHNLAQQLKQHNNGERDHLQEWCETSTEALAIWFVAMYAVDGIAFTPLRDESVIDSILNGTIGDMISNLGIDISILAGGFIMASLFGILKHHIETRDKHLQNFDDDYFIAQLIALNPNIKFFDDHNKDNELQAYLYFFGDNVLAPVRWYRQYFGNKEFQSLINSAISTWSGEAKDAYDHFNGENISAPQRLYRKHTAHRELKKYANEPDFWDGYRNARKKQLVEEATKAIYEKYGKQTRTPRVTFDHGRYQIIDADQFTNEDKANVEAGRTIIFQYNNQESQSLTIHYVLNGKYKTTIVAQKKDATTPIADFFKPCNIAHLHTLLKIIEANYCHPQSKQGQRWKTACFVGKTALQADLYYVYGFWVIWFSIWFTAGAAATTTALALGLTFGLPLIPFLLYIAAQVLSADKVAQHDCLSIAERNREIYLRAYRDKLNSDLVTLAKKLGHRLDHAEENNLISWEAWLELLADSSKIKDAVSDMPSDIDHKIRCLNRMGWSLMIIRPTAGLMTGVIVAGFSAWPIGAFFTSVLGIAFFATPTWLIIVFSVALTLGLFFAIKNGREMHDRHTAAMEQINSDDGKDKIAQLSMLQKQNAWLEQTIKEHYAKFKEIQPESKAELISVVSNIGTSDSVFRRMNTETTVGDRALDALDTGYAGIVSAGTGMLLPRLFFNVGCLFALATSVFLPFLYGMSAAWASFKMLECWMMREYDRDKVILDDLDKRIDAEKSQQAVLQEELKLLDDACIKNMVPGHVSLFANKPVDKQDNQLYNSSSVSEPAR